jgi:hypothetical protein
LVAIANVIEGWFFPFTERLITGTSAALKIDASGSDTVVSVIVRDSKNICQLTPLC